jgi:tetratricopeptide (TPR) repeat protein
MSLVNQVLRDLDARKAAPQDVGGLGLHMTAPLADHHEGFWRAIVVLMLIGLGCVAYLAYALRPQPRVATQLAYQYAGQIVRKPPTALESVAAPHADVLPVQTPPEPGSGQRDLASSALKLARSIETPLTQSSDRPSAQPVEKGPEDPVLPKSPPGMLDAREQARLHHLLGNVLASLARHEEAVGAYKTALEGTPQNGAVWLSLGISLEALNRRPDAVDAYGRALRTGSLERDESAFAEQRIARLR